MGKNNVGQFQVAVGAVIRLSGTNKILLIRRSSKLDWQPGEWEIVYGRMAQHERPEDALRREVREETGIVDLEITEVFRVWHIYRGAAKTKANELVGMTFTASTASKKVTLSSEHVEYQWVTVAQAIEIVHNEGIKQGLMHYALKYESRCCGSGC